MPTLTAKSGQELNNSELRILQYMSNGYETPDIAKFTRLSTNTVKYYRLCIYKKLNANSAMHAVAIAMRTGLIQ